MRRAVTNLSVGPGIRQQGFAVFPEAHQSGGLARDGVLTTSAGILPQLIYKRGT